VTEVAARQLAILAAARAAGPDALRLDPARLRFSLGASLGDVRVPVQVAPDAAAIVHAAAAELALLLVSHHRAFVPVDDLDRLLMADGYASLPASAATLGPSSGGAALRSAAQVGAAAHPALAGGVVCAWMGPGGRGRSLTGLFIEAFRQAIAEMEEARGREETPLLVGLALHGELLAAEAALRDRLPAPPLDRYLRTATFAGLWLAAQTGISRAWGASGRPETDPVLWKVEAALSPGALLGARGASLGGSTVYGCELTVAVPRGDELVPWLAQGGDPDSAIGAIAQALAADDELSRRAETAVAVAHVRALLLAGAVGAEAAGRDGGLAWLRELYAAPGALVSACADDVTRADLAARLASGAAAAGPPGDALERAAHALGAYRRKEPASCVGLTREAAREAYARAAGALACDAALERLLAPARRAVVARTGNEAEGGADAEWEEGRLYRVTPGRGRILRATAPRSLGHLFVDVKDFTRRTGLLGPAAMAEFLRTEFYGPILASAKGYFAGMPHLADRGGVAVNNLLGDAISFCGDIEALVALTAEIRRLLPAYEARLAREVSTEAVARQIVATQARLDAELARTSRALAEARAAGASPRRLDRLAADVARIRGERERARSRARVEGIEAGVFLSYGPAPVTVLIDDDVFGHNRVAIAEKINESARGTARTPGARARADAALAAERAASGIAGLQHAWNVFVGTPAAIDVPPELERVAIAAARAGDAAAAVRVLSGPVRSAVERLAIAAEDEPGEIYNSGAALSEEALTSYLEAVNGTRQLRRAVLQPDEIPASLRARWFYGTSPLELVAAFHPDGRPGELFRRAGLARFKGLGDVAVWELCADAGAAAELARHIAKAWFEG
jgi:hypothetical protein